MTIGPNPTPNPNAQPGQPGSTQPSGPAPIPEEFAERHVEIRPVAPGTGPALDAARQLGSATPNAPDQRPPVDLTHGTQSEQAQRLGEGLQHR